MKKRCAVHDQISFDKADESVFLNIGKLGVIDGDIPLSRNEFVFNI